MGRANWLPWAVRELLPRRARLVQFLSASGWLFADRGLRLAVNTAFTVLFARTYGPEDYGQFMLAIALVALLSGVSSLGLESIVVREIIERPEERTFIKGTAFALKLVGALATLLLSLATATALRPHDTSLLLLVGIIAVGNVFLAIEVIDFWFQAQLQYRYSVFARLPAFVLLSGVKFALIAMRQPLWMIALAVSAELVLAGAALVFAYRRTGGRLSAWSGDRARALRLLAMSWPLGVSGLMIMVYMRIDQVMIARFLGDAETGIYSVAVKLSEVWYLIPTSLGTVLFPMIVASRREGPEVYRRRLQKVFVAMTWLAITVAAIVSLSSRWIVGTLYGPDYLEAARVLALNIWAGVFVFQGVARGYWLVAEDLQRYSIWYIGAGAVTNIALNLLLIPALGIYGAALATLVSQATAVIVAPLLVPRTRPSSIMLLKSFVFRA